MRIKNIDTNTNVFLAPMAGYTDFGFRSLCAQFGAGLTTTEMVSTDALNYANEKTLPLLCTTDFEKVKCVQLFGHKTQMFEKALKNPHLAKFDIIDINMGCPAPKIFKNGDGSALLNNVSLACDIVKACKSCSDKPITVKMRLGVEDNKNAVNFAQKIVNAGADAITVHGRTTRQGYSGEVDYLTIKNIVSSVSVPVVANGNITTAEKMKEVLDFTNASAVAIGRASLGNPQIFGSLTGNALQMSNREIIDYHIKCLQQIYGEYYIFEFRKQLCFYLKNLENAKDLKVKAMKIENSNDLLCFLDNIYK